MCIRVAFFVCVLAPILSQELRAGSKPSPTQILSFENAIVHHPIFEIPPYGTAEVVGDTWQFAACRRYVHVSGWIGSTPDSGWNLADRALENSWKRAKKEAVDEYVLEAIKGVDNAYAHRLHGLFHKLVDLAANFPADQILVAIDFDNTLIRPTGFRGSDAWFGFHREKIERGRKSIEAATIEELIQRQNELFLSTDLQIMEEDTPEVFRNVVTNFPSIIATARGPENIEATELHQKEFDLFLDRSSLFRAGQVEIPVDDYTKPVVYKGGVLYTNGQKKAAAIAALAQKIGIDPKVIVLIDDRKSELHALHVDQLGSDVNVQTIQYSAPGGKNANWWNRYWGWRHVVNMNRNNSEN